MSDSTMITIQRLIDFDLGCFPSDDQRLNFLKNALSTGVFKKFEGQASSVLKDEALKNFLTWNESLKTSLPLDDYVVQLWRSNIRKSFLSDTYQSNCITLGRCLDRGYAGPGGSVGTKKTDFLGKMFSSPLSTTSLGLYRHYVSMLSPRWAAAENKRAELHGINIVVGSKLGVVPKDSTKMRTICTEPSLNMFYQLGAQEIMKSILVRDYGIDLAIQQDKNRELARLASIDGHLATIDLKNASDSISIELCQFLLPEETMSVLEIIRSHYTLYEGNKHKLNMISTMGNGFTFPLMTIIFSALLQAIYTVHGFKVTPQNYGVFGDDLICLTDVVPYVYYYLHMAGFTVNENKSFITGPFRESCGGDFYNGFNVRPVFIKRLDNESDFYSAINRLFDWSLMHGIPLRSTLQYLFGQVKIRPVPRHCGVSEGIRLPRDNIVSTDRDRNGAMFYNALVTRTRKYTVKDDHQNPDGAIIAFVGGYTDGNTVGVRSNTPRLKVDRRKTPNWDFSHSPSVTARDESIWWDCIFMQPFLVGSSKVLAF